MVQVDVFWSFGIGASFGVAASRQANARRAAGESSWIDSPYFVRTLLVIALLFVPSGACLLWTFPSWETMHAGDRSLPGWLATAFTITNVTQGLLGYWAALELAKRGKRYLAFLQWPAAYFCMFFVLVHGWDGSGYRRFFSSSRAAFDAWTSANVVDWLHSDVALTLYGMGVILVPALLYFPSTWIRDGARGARTSAGTNAWLSLLVIFGFGLAPAIVASLFVRYLGWGGLAAFAVVAWAALVRRGALLHRVYARIFGADDAPVEAPGRAELVGA